MKSVLIVDDSALIRRLLKAALTESGWIACTEAENGRDGIVKAQELRPDVIILDLAMPEMNGFEAARILNRLMPATPIFMFTTHCGPGLEREALAVGIQKVIPKSDGPPEIIRTLDKLFGGLERW